MTGLIVAWKPRFYDVRSAGTRIRCIAPMKALAAHGYATEVFKKSRREIYDVVVYSKLYDHDNFREASALQRVGTKIVFDLYDNHFFNPYDLPDLKTARDQICQMTALADVIVTSTDALASVMRDVCNCTKPIQVIGDCVETPEDLNAASPVWQKPWVRWRTRALIRQVRSDRERGIFPLVWYGIHGGQNAEYGMKDLENIKNVLEDINSRYPVTLTVISNARDKYRQIFKDWRIQTRYLEWNGYHLMDVLGVHSAAIIPISRNPFTVCKSSNRLTQALSAGLGVVADSIPSYQPFKGVCKLDDWHDGLLEYISKPDRLRTDVVNGQRLVDACCTKPVIGAQWQQLIATLRP